MGKISLIRRPIMAKLPLLCVGEVALPQGRIMIATRPITRPSSKTEWSLSDSKSAVLKVLVGCLLALPIGLALPHGSALAQDADQAEHVEVRIRHAVEVEFQSLPGHVYDVETSSDNVNWESVGDAYFGTGSRVRELISYSETGGKQKYFRVKVRNASEVGIAPVSVVGNTYLLNDGGMLRTVRFQNEATGTLALGDEHRRSFRYGYVKDGARSGNLRLLFNDDTSESLSFDFETAAAGAFKCERFEAGESVEKDAGTFSRIFVDKDVTLKVDPNAPAPESAIGYSFMLYGGNETNVLRILNDAIVKESLLNRSSSYRYDYQASGGTGFLTVWKNRARYDFYEFGFTSAGSGNFKRSQYEESVLKDVDAGVFSVIGTAGGVNLQFDLDQLGEGNHPSLVDAGATIQFPEDREAPTGGDTPPDESIGCEMPGDLNGICVEVEVNGKKEKLCFYTDDTGSVVHQLSGTSIFVPFEYTYESGSDRTGRLVIEFPTEEGNERLVFDLKLEDGCSGTYVRSQYRDEELVDRKTGSFSMKAELIVPDNSRPGHAAVIANPNAIGVTAEVVRTRVLQD